MSKVFELELKDPIDPEDYVTARFDDGLREYVYIHAFEQKFGDVEESAQVRLSPPQARELAYWLLEMTDE